MRALSARSRPLLWVAGLLSLLVFGDAAYQLFTNIGNSPWDFPVYYHASQQMIAGQDPYQDYLQHCPSHTWCRGGYIYTPLLAVAVKPLAGLSLVAAERVWFAVCLIALAAAFIVCWRLLAPLVERHMLVWLGMAWVVFMPLWDVLGFLQIGTVLLLLLALCAAAFVAGRALDAGMWLALGSVLRVTPVLVFPGLVVTEDRRRAVAATVATGVAGLTLLLLLQALAPWTLEFMTTVLPRIGGGTPTPDNVAPLGVLARATVSLGAPGWLQTLVTEWPVNLVTALLFLYPSVRVCLRARGRAGDPAVRCAVFAVFVAAMPAISSITWQHHLVTELLVFALLLPALRRGAVALPPLLLAYALTWLGNLPVAYIASGFNLHLGLSPAGLLLLALSAVDAVGMVLLWWITLRAVTRLASSGEPNPATIR